VDHDAASLRPTDFCAVGLRGIFGGMGRDFCDGDVAAANHDGFPLLYLINNPGKMGFGFGDIP
jgi:hypothetical protein